MPICPGCAEENPDKFRLCGFCGTALARPLPPQEVRKTVTIVFSDLKGSTSLGESLDPESLREVMNRYFAAMQTVLERHGGTVEKFIGDAVMAVFGLPTLHEDDALRAVRAAADMQRTLAQLNEEIDRVWGVTLTNRTGVNTGEVVAGDSSSGQRLVTGDAVNVAARLEQAAPAMEVLLGDLTYQLVRDATEVEAVDPLALKGKSERVPAYRLVSVSDSAAGRARRQDAPMVGRQAELVTLVSAYAAVVATRSCRLVSVVADAGAGKSRLNEEFMRSVEEDAQILRGRCLSYGEGVTFWPLVEAVRQAAAIHDDDPPEAARAKIAAIAGGDAAVADRVASAIGLSADPFPIEELFWGARKLLETLAQEKPLVVLFDDIHWAAPAFLDLIDHVLDVARDAPILLLCPARHDLLEARPEWAERPDAVRLILRPLAEAHAAQIVENLLGETGIADDVRARIVSAAEGNPLFVEQMLSMMIDSKRLQLEDGRWVAATDLGDVAVPPTIQALLAARLDRLPAEERAIVESASVIGLVFPQAALEELAPDTIRDRVSEHLASLARKQFVGPDSPGDGDERFRFSHVLIRDAAYAGLLKRARATLHERFVGWADRVNRERGRETEFVEILGYHLEQAHRYLSELGPLDDHGRELAARAAQRLASAGERAFGRGDMMAAANLLGRAAALFPERDLRRLELLPDLGEALVESGDFESAEAWLAEAATLARETADARLEAHSSLGHLLLRRYAGEANWGARVIEAAEQAITVFAAADDHAGLAKAYRLLCLAHGTACQFADFLAADERYLYHAEAAGDRRLQTHAVVATAIASTFGPTTVQDAIGRCEAVMTLTESSRRSAGIVTAHLALLHAMQGDFDRGRTLCAQARGILEDAGARMMAYARSIDAGAIELLAGDPVAAERELLRDYETLVQMGETYFASSIAALLGEALWSQGRYDDAERFCRAAQDLAAEDDVWTQAAWRCVRAKVLVQSEQSIDEAVALAGEAVDLLGQTDAPVWRGDAARDQAEVLRVAGRLSGARESLTEALRLYESKGDVASTELARRSFGQLAAHIAPA
jgi:predicted ATPase/class 3 adenylate cyclase